MAKLLHILFMLVSSITLIFAGTGESTITTSVPTELVRVYLHAFFSGPNATSHEVARASITAHPVNFGMVRVANDFLTTGPDLTTGKLGQAEVMIAFSRRTEPAALLQIEMRFEAGRYNGSSISLLGRKRLGNFTEEVPIVGGTGQFRAARGYSLSYIYSYDPVTDYIIYIYDMYVYTLQQLGCVN